MFGIKVTRSLLDSERRKIIRVGFTTPFFFFFSRRRIAPIFARNTSKNWGNWPETALYFKRSLKLCFYRVCSPKTKMPRHLKVLVIITRSVHTSLQEWVKQTYAKKYESILTDFERNVDLENFFHKFVLNTFFQNVFNLIGNFYSLLERVKYKCAGKISITFLALQKTLRFQTCSVFVWLNSLTVVIFVCNGLLWTLSLKSV